MDKTKEAALQFFKPYFNQFLECKNATNKKYANLIAEESRADIKSRSYSSCLNDLFVKSLMVELADIDGIVAQHKFAQTTFLFDEQYWLKSKKIDDHYRLSYTPTALALEFLEFNIQLPLPITGEPVRVILCYRLNPIHTEIADIFLACPNGKNSFSWVHKIEPVVEVRVIEND